MLKIGASPSLLIATIILLSFIPARCWIAPEIPTAIYKSGTTTFPVWPTWWSLLIYPASTAAREAPTAALSLSAMSVISLKLSPLSNPLPPDITTLAVPSSGLSDFVSSLLRNFEKLGTSTASTFSTWAEPPVLGAGSNYVGLIVTHFFLSLLFTVAKAFPA